MHTLIDEILEIHPPEITNNSYLDQEVIIPSKDDRKPLTYFAPWRYICQIEIRSVSGRRRSRGVGTGTLIGPRSVLTAAHNTWRKKRSDISVYQGRNGPKSLLDSPPTGKIRAAKVQAIVYPRGLTNPLNYRQRHLDYAIIHLKEPIGKKFGYWSFRYRKWKDDRIGTSIWSSSWNPSRLSVNIAGYPGDIRYPAPSGCRKCTWDKFGDFLYWDFDKTVYNDGKLLKYKNDTFKGNSGSPIFLKRSPYKGGRVLIGIHTGAGDKTSGSSYNNNRAVFINRQVQQFIRKNIK